MSDYAGLEAKRPTQLMLRTVKFNYKDLVKALAKGCVCAGVADWKGLAQQAVDAFAAIGLKDTPEEKAWLLIQTALIRAVYTLVGESAALLNKPGKELEHLEESFNFSMDGKRFYIDREFFANPRSLKIMPSIINEFDSTLKTIGFIPVHATSISSRLMSYFVHALYDEWRENSSKYECISVILDSPFGRALENELAWKRYQSMLIRQIHESMMGEPFGIARVYIPLRAYFTKKEKKKCRNADDKIDGKATLEEKHIAVSLDRTIHEWITNADMESPIRIVCGGPGCGKSSFAKMLAAKLAEESKRVVFIPLDKIGDDEALEKSVGDFLINGGWFQSNPLDEKGEQIVLIFDGLVLRS